MGREQFVVGVEVLIVRNDTVLLGKRRNSVGEGTWAPCGGALELGESIEEAAIREAYEETGLQIRDIKIRDVARWPDKLGGITVLVIAGADGEPELREPHKCEGWHWFSFDNLPEPLFGDLAVFERRGTLR